MEVRPDYQSAVLFKYDIGKSSAYLSFLQALSPVLFVSEYPLKSSSKDGCTNAHSYSISRYIAAHQTLDITSPISCTLQSSMQPSHFRQRPFSLHFPLPPDQLNSSSCITQVHHKKNSRNTSESQPSNPHSLLPVLSRIHSVRVESGATLAGCVWAILANTPHNFHVDPYRQGYDGPDDRDDGVE